nr:MAG TPA: hypothetical protein [Caudoviricetes sp.]
MAGGRRYFEFNQFPAYRQMYQSAFARMLDARRAKGLNTQWAEPKEVMAWWMGEDINQIKIIQYIEGEN